MESYKLHLKFLNKPEIVRYYTNSVAAYAALNILTAHGLVTYAKVSLETSVKSPKLKLLA